MEQPKVKGFIAKFIDVGGITRYYKNKGQGDTEHKEQAHIYSLDEIKRIRSYSTKYWGHKDYGIRWIVVWEK